MSTEAPRGITLPQTPTFITACGALIALGSTGPWAHVGPLSVSGTDGDGTITLLIAAGIILTGLLQFGTERSWLICLAGLAVIGCAVTGIVDWQQITTATTGPLGLHASAGWGIQVVAIVGCLGALAVVVVLLRRAVTE